MIANKKLCLINNTAAHYRKGIFKLIDSEFECVWYFGEQISDIKTMDLSILKETHYVKNCYIKGHWYWQIGINKLLKCHNYSTFLLLGEPYNLAEWFFLIRRKLFFPKKRVYMWTHGWYGKESRLRSIVKYLFFRMADGIFVYGNYARNLMIDYGFAPERLFTIHNSLDYNRQIAIRRTLKESNIYKTHFGNNNQTIIFIGRLTKVKRLDLLLSALVLLKESCQYFNLVFVGDGVCEDGLKRQVDKLGLKETVWFYGACYDDVKNAKLIYNADLCVAPGNVGLTAIHVMMFGTPVITHDNYSYQMPEFESIIEGTTGAFFEQDNVQSLADTIKRWCVEHVNQREEVRQACYSEIDSQWTPEFQMNVIRKYLIL